MRTASYALALGANRRSGRHGPPARILRAAAAAIEAAGIVVVARSPVIATRPMGPGSRVYANAALLVASDLAPPDMLAVAKRIERAFGRRPGRRWGDRVLDIDLLLWSGGAWRSRGLAVPHAGLETRRFVLDPLAVIAPGWRVPCRGMSVAHLRHRLTHPRPVA